MYRLLPILFLAFKIWMLVDCGRKRVPTYWYFIIIIAPFGDVAYFFVYKIHDFNWRSITKIFSGPPSLDEVRYRAETSPSLLNNIALAQALHDHGRHDEAIARFAKILDQYPTNSDALYGLASSQIAKREHDEAIRRLETLVELDPTYLDYLVWRKLAETCWNAGRKDESLEWLRKLVKLNPRPDHQVVLARCLVQLDHRSEAKTLIDGALLDYDHSPAYAKKIYRAVASEMRRMRKAL